MPGGGSSLFKIRFGGRKSFLEDKKRTVMAVVIIVVVLAAVLYSFFLNLFAPTPRLEMADPNAGQSTDPVAQESGQSGGVAVEVTPQTVQSLIASLERYESYRRTVSVEYFDAGQSVGTVTAQVWVEAGWARTSAALSSGVVEHSVVGDGTLWLWYDGGERVYSGPAADRAADLSQRLPTYEDVLALDKSSITAAGYEERDSQPCVYVEAAVPGGGAERYWVSVSSGLLVAAETELGGEVVYAMSSRDVVSPLDETEGIFTLPDGSEPHGMGK